VTRVEVHERLAKLEADEKNIFHQLTEIKEEVKDIRRLTLAVEKIAVKTESIDSKVDEMGTRISAVEREPTDDFKHYKDFYDVTLYLCYYYTYNKLFVTYKFKENYKDIYSEERQKIILNTPEHMVESTAISIALNDIKRKVSIEIKYCGKIFNKRNNIRRQLLLFKKTKEKYNRIYLKYMNIIYYSTKELNFNKQYLIIANLRRHCLAMPRQADKKYEIIKYNDLI